VSHSPEDSRLAERGPRDVTLYTRPGCHLCEEAKAAIAPLLREFVFVLHEVNIDEDTTLKELYRWDVPVIFIGQRKVAKHHVDLAQFSRQLQEAQ
jgi:glutaredoxin